MSRAAVIVLVLTVSVGCGHRSTAAPVPITAAIPRPTPLGQPGCLPPSPIEGGEVQGTGHGNVSLWGLIFGQVPLRMGKQVVKIVWRMTGGGALHVASFDPAGQKSPLVFGPEPHSSSSYHRPGDEWGTGFVFNQPGCWRVELTRQTGAATVYFAVV